MPHAYTFILFSLSLFCLAIVSFFENDMYVAQEVKQPVRVKSMKSYLNLPPQYSLSKKQPYSLKKTKCAEFPYVYDIKFSNTYWQVLETHKEILYMFAAYYEVRKANKRSPAIVILANTRSNKPTRPYCQIWFNDTENAAISRVVDIDNGGPRFNRLNNMRNQRNNWVIQSLYNDGWYKSLLDW